MHQCLAQPVFWERGEFPFELIPKLRDLQIVGDTMQGYGTVPMTAVGQGLISYEMARLDGSIGTFLGVHVGLAMQSIYKLGSEEQCERWLPAMASFEKIGAFALTSPITAPTQSRSRRPHGATGTRGSSTVASGGQATPCGATSSWSSHVTSMTAR
jgi:alkylation response protein AidB-like acyl-CoA dehydrogenase